MSALDLLLILNDIESFKELQNFIEFMHSKQLGRIHTMSEYQAFIYCLGMHGLISEGAIDFDMLSVAHDFPSVILMICLQRIIKIILLILNKHVQKPASMENKSCRVWIYWLC